MLKFPFLSKHIQAQKKLSGIKQRKRGYYAEITQPKASQIEIKNSANLVVKIQSTLKMRMRVRKMCFP